MVKYKMIFDREACIGAIACSAIAPDFWLQADDGKVDLKGATFNEETKKWELIIDEKDFDLLNESAEVCPVDVIWFEKIEE
jgi:ferredoxin